MENKSYPENIPPQSFKYEPLPDLSQYEEVSYVPTPEENETIKKYHALLKEMGYEDITEATDFDQLFWDLGYRKQHCDKFLRIAIIDNIYYKRLIPKFMGMARRYNGWLNRMLLEESELKKTLKEYKAGIRETLEKEYLKRKIQLDAHREQLKIEKSVWKMMRSRVKRCDAAILSWYCLTNESGIKGFLKLCTSLDVKVKPGAIRRIYRTMKKDGKDPTLFQSMVEEYNRQWCISRNIPIDAPESEEEDGEED